MGLPRAQEPIWLNAWLEGVFNFKTDTPVNGKISEIRLCIEDTMLESIKPYDLGLTDERYVEVAQTYNEVSFDLILLCFFQRRERADPKQAHGALTISDYTTCLTSIQRLQRSYLTTQEQEYRDYGNHHSEMLWEATVFWKANLMEMMIAPLSHVSPIVGRTFSLLPPRMAFYNVIVNAYGGRVPEVFEEFVQLCYNFDTRPKWFHKTSERDLSNLEEDGFLPVNEKLREIRRRICR